MTGAREDESPTAYAIRVVKEQGAAEMLEKVTRVLVAAYPNPDRLLDDTEITVRCTLREIATALGVDLDAALAKEEPEEDSDDQNLAEHTARTRGGLAGALEQFARSELANLDPDLPRAPIAEGAGS